MGAGCSEQGTPGAGGRADLFFDALCKYAVTRTMTALNDLIDVAEVVYLNRRPIERYALTSQFRSGPILVRFDLHHKRTRSHLKYGEPNLTITNVLNVSTKVWNSFSQAQKQLLSLKVEEGAEIQLDRFKDNRN